MFIPGEDYTVNPLNPNTTSTKAQVRTDPAPALTRMVEKAFLKPSDRVLCYGCGRGADVTWLKRHNFAVDGFDPHPPFGFSAAPTGKYDAVLLIYLMTRLQNDALRRETLAKAAEFVRPGGHLVIISRYWARWLPPETPPEPAAAMEHLHQMLPPEAFLSIQIGEFENADHALCILARKSGIYRPRLPVEWLDQAAAVQSTCALLHAEPFIALDVETTLEEPRTLCTIQLGAAHGTWIIDALAVPDLTPVQLLLENEGVEKVIHNAQFEEQMFAKHGIRIRPVFDTLIASRKKYKKNAVSGHKLNEVCERELGIYLDKTLQTSDWTRRPLSEAQLDYAAIDAEVLVDLYRVFHPPQPPENLELFPAG